MAVKFLTSIDLTGNELLNPRLQNLATDPTGSTGRIYFNTASTYPVYYNGTAWIEIKPANDATTTTNGVVRLAGDLGGAGTTAAAPVISAGAITYTKVNAALKPSGTAATTDEALRALGTTAGTALSGTTTLSSIAAPTGDVTLAGFKITNLATPTAGTDAVNKNYVDNLAAGLDVKGSVRAATTAAGTLATSFENGDILDGVTLATGDRILVKNQAAPEENGIYTVNATGAPTRATDFDAWTEIPGSFVFIEEGTTLGDTGWVSTANQGGTLGTTAITWAQFSSSASLIAGDGLGASGNTWSVNVDNSTIEINADTLRVKAAGINLTTHVTGTLPIANGGTNATTASAARTNLFVGGYYSSATHAAGTSISITQATHTLRASKGLVVQVQDEATGAVEFADVVVAASGDVTVTFAVSQTANSKRVTIIG